MSDRRAACGRHRWIACAIVALVVTVGPLALAPGGTTGTLAAADVGEWGPVVDLGMQGKHASLLPTGKVLIWSTGDNARVWDPATGVLKPVPFTFGDLHCAAQATLADGRVVVVGGQNGSPHIGTRVTALFDPFSETWVNGAPMAYSRWYGTATTLADGRLLASGGDDENGNKVQYNEIYDPATNTWTTLPLKELGLYPFVYQLPDGRVYNAGPKTATTFIDVGAGAESPGPTAIYQTGGYTESGAMYEPGKIIRTGGLDPGSPRTQIVDMTAASPAWQETSPMAFGRRRHNIVLLADGNVMAVGGTRQADDASQAVLEGEIWDPATKVWRTVAPMSVPRMYHSTAVLLADGRVLTAGGEGASRLSSQVYSPPYLFKGARPVIESAPDTVAYGGSFSVGSPDADGIVSVALLRPGAVTHAIDMNQRYVPLTFTKGTGALNVTAPANANIAPPGSYMLLISNGDGVPSVARWVRVGSSAALEPGSVTGIVTDADTTAPIEGASVSYTGGSTTTDVDGRYTLGDVPAGEHVVTVGASGYASTSGPVVVSAGASTTADWALSRPGTLAGTVTDAGTGAAIAGATVAVGTASTTTDADGKYQLSAVPAGTHSVTASAAGYQSSTQSATVPAGGTATADFALAASQTFITGEVRNASTGDPLVGAGVSIPGKATTTDALGRYRIDDTPPATYQVTAAAAGFTSVTSEAVVTTGAYATVDFALSPAPPAPASPLSFGPVEDSFVRSNYVSEVNGSQPSLRVYKSGSTETHSYLRFDVSGLAGGVASARLRLFVVTGSAVGGSVFGVADTGWQEETMSWSSRPATAGSATRVIGAVTAGQWVEVDVTPLVTGNGLVSMAVKNGGAKAWYSSKEGSQPPQLVVVPTSVAFSSLSLLTNTPTAGPTLFCPAPANAV